MNKWAHGVARYFMVVCVFQFSTSLLSTLAHKAAMMEMMKMIIVILIGENAYPMQAA